MRKALIHAERVCQIEAADKTFPVAPELRWVDCPDDVTTQHTYVGGVFVVVPPPPVIDGRAGLRESLAAATTVADLKAVLAKMIG